MGEIYDYFTHNLYLYREAFLRKTHINLWDDMRNAYDIFSIEAFEHWVQIKQADKERMTSLQECLMDYCETFGIGPLCLENRYARISIKNLRPQPRNVYHNGHEQYQMYLANIQRHLDNAEDFTYEWRSSNNICVCGTMNDNLYHAYAIISRNIKPEVDTYYLLNTSYAVFKEED